jgi:hypothetical protein
VPDEARWRAYARSGHDPQISHLDGSLLRPTAPDGGTNPSHGIERRESSEGWSMANLPQYFDH